MDNNRVTCMTPCSAGHDRVTVSQIPSITDYEKKDIIITFNFEKNPTTPGSFQIKMKAKNTAFVEITSFLFQAAVPKVYTAIL